MKTMKIWLRLGIAMLTIACWPAWSATLSAIREIPKSAVYADYIKSMDPAPIEMSGSFANVTYIFAAGTITDNRTCIVAGADRCFSTSLGHTKLIDIEASELGVVANVAGGQTDFKLV